MLIQSVSRNRKALSLTFKACSSGPLLTVCLSRPLSNAEGGGRKSGNPLRRAPQQQPATQIFPVAATAEKSEKPLWKTPSSSNYEDDSSNRNSHYNSNSFRNHRFLEFRILALIYDRLTSIPPILLIAGCIGGGLLFFVSLGLDVVPESGRTRWLPFPRSWEVSLGESSYEKLLATYKGRLVPHTSPTYRVVETVAKNLINAINTRPIESSTASSNSQNKKISPPPPANLVKWRIHVIDDPTPNAFVLPNGAIFVFTGILPICQDEDGIASVIGHEIAHVIARHSGEKLGTSLTISGIILTLDLMGMPPPRFLTNLITNFGIMLPNSRACEREADRIGIEIMSRACYDPRQSVEMWKRMSAYEQEMMKQSSRGGSGGGGGMLPEFFSTHPSNENRQEDLKKLLPQMMETRSQVGSCKELDSFHNFVSFGFDQSKLNKSDPWS